MRQANWTNTLIKIYIKTVRDKNKYKIQTDSLLHSTNNNALKGEDDITSKNNDPKIRHNVFNRIFCKKLYP